MEKTAEERSALLARWYRRCSAPKLEELRCVAVREGDALAVRLLDEELPRARRDANDDSWHHSHG
jgi:hypothetical protein